MKICPIAKNVNVSWKICLITIQPSLFLPNTLKINQSGEISPNLVTLTMHRAFYLEQSDGYFFEYISEIGCNTQVCFELELNQFEIHKIGINFIKLHGSVK